MGKMSLNASEERLGKLSRQTFLSMWSYENPYYEQGKELCDVLIVFGNEVIVISDKLNAFGTHSDDQLNWRRWHKKAVAASVRQLVGARNQIIKAPDKIFTNAQVSYPLPLRLPPADQMKFHLIAVANGSDDACLRVLGRKGLRVDTQRRDDAEMFTVGTFSEDGDFVHIFSATALEAVFRCLDTARDLIDYLNRKKEAFADKHWTIEGEENLLAAYMLSQPGNGAFSIPHARFETEHGVHSVPAGIWQSYENSSFAKHRDDWRKKSYIIDQLIEDMADDYKQQRLIIGHDKALSYHEQAFRILASESRLSRQVLGLAFREIYFESTNTFWSIVCTSMDSPRIYYVWLLYPEPPVHFSVDQMETCNLRELTKYMAVTRAKFPSALRVFGICLPNRDCKQNSRFYQVSDGENWTPEMQESAEHLQQDEGILSTTDQIQIGASR